MRKGIKSSYLPVIKLAKEIIQQVDVIVTLLAHTKSFTRKHSKSNKNETSQLLCATMNILRYGICSDNHQVAEWCIRSVTQIISRFEELGNNKRLIDASTLWFFTGGGNDRKSVGMTGLQSVIYAMKKHMDLPC